LIYRSYADQAEDRRRQAEARNKTEKYSKNLSSKKISLA
jgi:hypothetical protein